MGAERKAKDEAAENDRWLPPPVPGGTWHVESLGRWIDNLLGDARIRRRVEAELRPHFLREDEMPDDPPPAETPPPVPD
ncbi:MAG: hypothetical protein ACRD1T_18580 [Acidimicrobiia bacterium]